MRTLERREGKRIAFTKGWHLFFVHAQSDKVRK